MGRHLCTASLANSEQLPDRRCAFWQASPTASLVIGRRPVSATFGHDVTGHAKLMRFFDP
jgi:hypothetical protein